MVFGSFSEKYEFAAMKSTGISLQRAMRSCMIFIGILSIVAFFFANNVIPYSEYKWQNLRRNIAQVSPSMAIVEGQFSKIGENFNIKVDEKYGDNDQFLREVVIHQKKEGSERENTTVIIAEEGELVSAEGSNTLSLILKKGNYYENIKIKDRVKERTNQPFAKSFFEEYTINIDLTELNNTDINKENNISSHNMYKISELIPEIDRLATNYNEDIKVYTESMYARTGMPQFADSIYKKSDIDTTYTNVLDIFDTAKQRQIITAALGNVGNTLNPVLSGKKKNHKDRTKSLNKHEIALHEKYVLAVACIILFFVGAPLGAIIRKGGMGLPMVVAIVLFLVYHFIGIFAKNSAEDGTTHPFIASWLSTFIMMPLGVWLTYRATTDQGIVDMDAFFQRIAFWKKKDQDPLDEEQIFLTQQEKALVLSRNTEQLKNIVKNYEQLGYSEEVKKAAIRELKRKKIPQNEIDILLQ